MLGACPHIGCETKFFIQAARGSGSLRDARSLRRCLQNSSNLRLLWMQRRARMFSAPDSDQNLPDCLQRPPITALQPASTTPEPKLNGGRELQAQVEAGPPFFGVWNVLKNAAARNKSAD